MSLVEDREWLIAYDDGMCGLRDAIIAPPVDAIRARNPELQVADPRPDWMTDERYAERRSQPLWLDVAVPTGY